MILSPSDIYQLALGAGFPSDTAVKMTAIALKESAGNPRAFNGVAPDESYGLWQINMLGSLGDRRMQLFGLSDKSQLFDPVTNARAAYLTWGGDDRNLDIAWSIDSNSYEKGRYQSFLPLAIAAGGGSSSPSVVPDLGTQVSSLFSDADPVLLGIGAGLVGLMLFDILS
jgi:hypothetical protein